MIPNRSEVRGLFWTGDGQTTGRRNGQSLFNDITEKEKEKENQEEEKRL